MPKRRQQEGLISHQWEPVELLNLALLEKRPGPGDWVLVHMGFALQVMTEAEAADALAALSAERDAEAAAPSPGP
jgi:hydrogenase assembly chaperone HypC/HupF